MGGRALPLREDGGFGKSDPGWKRERPYALAREWNVAAILVPTVVLFFVMSRTSSLVDGSTGASLLLLPMMPASLAVVHLAVLWKPLQESLVASGHQARAALRSGKLDPDRLVRPSAVAEPAEPSLGTDPPA